MRRAERPRARSARRPAASSPATEWIAVTSSAASSVERRQDAGQPPRQHRLAAARADRRSSRWWPPAAAISSARRASGWPSTSARSAPSRAAPRRRAGRGRPERRRRRIAQRGDRLRRACRTATIAAPGTIAASAALARGSEHARGCRRAAPRPPTGSTPRVGCMAPSSDSSPTHAARRRGRARRARPPAARTPSAIGRSKPAPTLRTSAGARFTVMRCVGIVEARVADRGAHAIAALAHAGVGQADDGEAGEPVGDVDLGEDEDGLEAGERGGADAREHQFESEIRHTIRGRASRLAALLVAHISPYAPSSRLAIRAPRPRLGAPNL